MEQFAHVNCKINCKCSPQNKLLHRYLTKVYESYCLPTLVQMILHSSIWLYTLVYLKLLKKIGGLKMDRGTGDWCFGCVFTPETPPPVPLSLLLASLNLTGRPVTMNHYYYYYYYHLLLSFHGCCKSGLLGWVGEGRRLFSPTHPPKQTTLAAPVYYLQ